MAEVTLNGVSKFFGTTKVIEGIDLAIADRELMVVVGPSGCGKSTLLRLVAGLEEASGGEIRIGGRLVNRVEPKDRDIAMVFQNYALYPHMSVRENMAYGLKIRGLPKSDIEARVRRAAETLQLMALLDRKPRQLSGGQRQRVAMGRALVREPQVFLFDEPLSNLDAQLRVQMRVEIKRLQQSLGITSIYVTHDQVEAMTLADRLVVMKAGVAEQIGTPLDLYERPETVFVASFIGSPAMNLLPGMLESDRVSLGSGVTLALAASRSNAPRAVTVGLRPEHLLPDAGVTPFTLTVELSEMLGADTVVHGRIETEGPMILARLPGTVRAAPGERLPLTIAPEHVHLFDRESGKRI
ncbi:MAG TPA: sn-glycerol-3-phosphate import ATP-binding protein UgpC [Stellaceae bacterium]|nr:sn-glycerol-3-phosphate import ATP-binding protein UgpC [Stellaceae bacterium]